MKILNKNSNIYADWIEFNPEALKDADFIQGFCKVKFDDETYNFIDEKGNLLSDDRFKFVIQSDFSNFGIILFRADNSSLLSNNSDSGYIDEYGIKYPFMYVSRFVGEKTAPFKSVQDYLLKTFSGDIKFYIFKKML